MAHMAFRSQCPMSLSAGANPHKMAHAGGMAQPAASAVAGGSSAAGAGAIPAVDSRPGRIEDAAQLATPEMVIDSPESRKAFLGALEGLEGDWEGVGMNQISLPNFEEDQHLSFFKRA